MLPVHSPSEKVTWPFASDVPLAGEMTDDEAPSVSAIVLPATALPVTSRAVTTIVELDDPFAVTLFEPVRTTVDVPAFTLDRWVDRVGVDLQTLAFVKLDVQGAAGLP